MIDSSKRGYEKAVQTNKGREGGLKPTDAATRRERAVDGPVRRPEPSKGVERKAPGGGCSLEGRGAQPSGAFVRIETKIDAPPLRETDWNMESLIVVVTGHSEASKSTDCASEMFGEWSFRLL
jgi:hypothetical protein